jgi:hypothetical protein
MSAVTTVAYVVGAIAMTAGGFALAAFLLFWAASASGKYAWRIWKNLSGIYRVETMKYWFRRMEKEGNFVLRQALADNPASQEAAEQKGGE